MFASYLLTLYRSLAKHQLFSALNIVGLAVGMAVFLLLAIVSEFELSYDRWIPHADRTFRVSGVMNIPGRPQEVIAPVPGPVLPTLQADFPQIEAGVRLLQGNMAVRRGEQGDYERIVFADPTFFDVFDLPMAQGEGARSLADTSGVVVSQAMAEKYFGQGSALGQRLTITTDGAPRDFRVTGVLRDLPENTHLTIDFLIRLDRSIIPGLAEYLDQWNATNYVTYVRLPDAATREMIDGQLAAYVARRSPDVAEWMGLRLEAVPRLHFAAEQMGAFKPGVDRIFVTTLQVIAVLTLLLAVINYVNLATARSVLRAREVALRKVFGATRAALIGQFLVEALVVTLLAGLIALALVELTLPLVNAALGRSLELRYLGADGVLPLFAGIVAAVGLAAGLYPAFVLSKFEPAGVLASSRAPGGGRGAAALREVLVVAQFAVSITLMICTAVVFAQAEFVRRADVGFQREGLIIVKQLDNPQVWSRARTLQETFRRLPGVEAVTVSGRAPGNGGVGRSDSFTRDGLVGAPPALSWEMVGDGYFDTYKATMVAGRGFSTANRLDDLLGLGVGSEALRSRGLNVIVNEAAVKALQFRRPDDALNQVIRPGDGTPMRIVGVAEDIRFGSPREKVPPIIYFKQAGEVANFSGNPAIAVRYRGDPQQVLASLESTWRRIAPEAPFEGETVEASLNTFYEPDDQRSRLITMGSVVAVLIGCLGLYGLAAFNSERRTKEIGIRKVLGASTTDVVRLLVGQFLRPVVIANLIAWPAAFVAMRRWLGGFDQAVDLHIGPFLAATALALTIALVTVLGQALRVSRSEPGRALRHQ